MSNFGKKYNKTTRELNKTLRENKYNPKDPYRQIRQDQKRAAKQHNSSRKVRKTKIKLNLWSWLFVFLVVFFIVKR